MIHALHPFTNAVTVTAAADAAAASAASAAASAARSPPPARCRMPFIVVAPAAQTVQLGLAGPFPSVTVPSDELPLQPALSFATQLLIVCAQHLSLTKEQLSCHELVVACPSAGLPLEQRCILRRAADLLRIAVRFYAPYLCARAVAARHCTVVDIAFDRTVIFDDCRVHAVAVGLKHVADRLRPALAPLGHDAVRVAAAAAVVPRSEHQPLGALHVPGGSVPGELRSAAAQVLFDHDDERNLACAVARFVRDERDVYARERSRWVLCIGEGALPGVEARLQQEFERCRNRFGVHLPLRVVLSPFDGAIARWVGAAALATAACEGDDDEDRVARW